MISVYILLQMLHPATHTYITMMMARRYSNTKCTDIDIKL